MFHILDIPRRALVHERFASVMPRKCGCPLVCGLVVDRLLACVVCASLDLWFREAVSCLDKANQLFHELLRRDTIICGRPDITIAVVALNAILSILAKCSFILSYELNATHFVIAIF